MQRSWPPVYWLCDYLSCSINVVWANVLNTDLGYCRMCNSFFFPWLVPHQQEQLELYIIIVFIFVFILPFLTFFRSPVTQSLCPSLWASSSLLSPSTTCQTGISSSSSLNLKILVPPSAAFTSLFLSRPLTNKVRPSFIKMTLWLLLFWLLLLCYNMCSIVLVFLLTRESGLIWYSKAVSVCF